MSQQSITFTFQDPGGNPLALGTVQVRLNTDASLGTSGGPEVAARRTTFLTLDSSGSVTFLIWPNDTLLPAGTVYIVDAYSAQGQPVFSGQMTVDSSANITWVIT